MAKKASGSSSADARSRPAGTWTEAQGTQATIFRWGDRPGTEIVGILKGRHTATTQFGESEVYEIRDTAAKRTHAVFARGELARKLDEIWEFPGIGSAIRILFESWAKGKSAGQRRRVFRVWFASAEE